MNTRFGRYALLGGLLALVGSLVAIGALPSISAAQSTTTVQSAPNAKFGNILVDSKGMSLYMLSSEAGGVIVCTGSCASAWPSLTAGGGSPTAGPGVSGTLGTVTRPDGTVQVTYNGFPLHLYTGDSKPGDTTGDGLMFGSGAYPGTWNVVTLAAAAPTATATSTSSTGGPLVATGSSSLGTVLVNGQGFTLYYNTAEANASKFVCTGACLGVWPPIDLAAGQTSPPAVSGAAGTFGVVTRPEGDHQVTYNGYPLYMFANDKKAGDTNGNGIQAFGGTWMAALASSVVLAASPGARLTVHIPMSGRAVLGHVTVEFALDGRRITRACGSATCRLGVPTGIALRVAQRANGSGWRFQGWRVKTGSHQVRTAAGPALRLILHRNGSVSALYAAR